MHSMKGWFFQFKKVNFLLILLFVAATVKSQKTNQFRFTPNIGITTPILDNGLGVLTALNIEGRALEYVSGEGQISYSYNRIHSSFLRGEKGHRRGFNVLLGPRFYFNSSEHANRFYVNLLFGGIYRNDTQENRSDFKAVAFGHSFGLYWSNEKLILGGSFDSYALFSLRVGWSI